MSKLEPKKRKLAVQVSEGTYQMERLANLKVLEQKFGIFEDKKRDWND